MRTGVESNRGKGLDRQLLAAVDGIAEVDPGASADPAAPSPGPGPSAAAPNGDDLLDDVGDSFRLGVLIVAAAIALPFLARGARPARGVAPAPSGGRGA